MELSVLESFACVLSDVGPYASWVVWDGAPHWELLYQYGLQERVLA